MPKWPIFVGFLVMTGCIDPLVIPKEAPPRVVEEPPQAVPELITFKQAPPTAWFDTDSFTVREDFDGKLCVLRLEPKVTDCASFAVVSEYITAYRRFQHDMMQPIIITK